MLKLIILTIAAAAGLTAQTGQGTVFKRNVFNGVTTAQASAALPNIGQAVHIMMVYFPTAVADVSAFTIRVEGSFDNSTYFPISEDVTTATYNGTFAYNISRCNAPYPYVRLRYVTAHASLPLTAHYTGALQPIGLVRLSGTRYIADSPLAGASQDSLCTTIGGYCYIEGRRMTPIIPADWPTNVNHNASTVRTDGANSILLDTYGGSRTLNMVCRSLPASPYHIRIHYYMLDGNRAGDNPNDTGIMLRNSSDGKLITHYHYLYNTFAIGKWASPSSEASTYLTAVNLATSNLNSVDIVDNGTNRIFRWWDGQSTYRQYQGTAETSGRTDYTTPDQICFGNSMQNGNYRTQMRLVGYDIEPTW